MMGPTAVILLPALGGLVFGPLIYFFAREAKGHGVPEVMLAVAQRGGRIRPVVAVIKSLASALCIGSGGSVGREGPIVQIGSTIGSTLGQLFRMSDDRIRTLVACGAAGGIAATFNAPIAGVFFALEIILVQFDTRAFGVVVISSVTASVIGRSAFGNVPAFPVPAYEMVNVGEFALYAVLGLFAGIGGVAFTRTLYWFEDRFDEIKMPEYLKPVLGGLALGGLGLFLPQVFGVGYPAIDRALHGNFGLALLTALVFAKILAVSLTIGSGGSGGVFAPSLFVGAMLGTAFGAGARVLLPGVVGSPGAYGLVGMAAVFTGAARAPITSVIILFEMTGDYRIILPLMVTVAISTFVSEALMKDTIYTLKLRRRGIDIMASRGADLMSSVKVSQAMTSEIPTVPRDFTVIEAAEQLRQSRERALVVVDDSGALEGIVTIQEIEQALLENEPGMTLEKIASRPVETAFPDETLTQAIQRMGARDLRQLPVVSRSDPNRAIGMLRRSDIVSAYSTIVLHRVGEQQHKPVSAGDLRGMQLVRVTVGRDTPLEGHHLSSLGLPSYALVITVERGQDTIVPRGETLLIAGDQLVILVKNDAVQELHEYLASLPREARASPVEELGNED